MDIARERLARNFLIRSPFSSASEVVHALGAIQAQDFEGAKWAIAQRALGLTDTRLERAFADGEFLRTHVLRPTWHFVTPADIRWMLELTAPRIKRAMASYDRKLELDDKLFRRANAAIERALRDGRHRTRAELKWVLARARVGPLGVQRAAHIVMHAELDAVICSGPRRGSQFTYALLDERAPAMADRDRDESLLDLTLRYFRTRSPATAQDYAWWSGLAMSDVKRGIDLARANANLESATIAGVQYWIAPGDVALRTPLAHLLPNYDEFFIGFRDRSAIGQRLASTHAVTGGNAAMTNVAILDGQLVGGWKRVKVRSAIELHVKLLARISGAEHRRLTTAVRQYESFTGRAVELKGLASKTRGASTPITRTP